MGIKTFFYNAHCEKGVPSSKRLYGGIGFTIIQLCLLAASILSLVSTGGLSEIIKDLLIFDLSISATLLGLSTITGAFGANKSVTVNQEEKQEDA